MENVTDRIEELKQQILQLIEKMERDNDRKSIDEVQKLQKEYWELGMQKYIPSIPLAKRNEVLKYMTDFIPLGISNQYFSRENILDVLKQLTIGISAFGLKSGDIRGSWQGAILSINPTKVSGVIRNTVYHEMSHCVTMYRIMDDKESIREFETIKIKVGDDKTDKNEEGHRQGKIRVRKGNPPVDLSKMTIDGGWKFISEVIAEEMAQTMFYSGMARPSKTKFASMLGGTELESNWLTPFNRHYQQFGEGFVKTLYSEPNTTKGFKRLTDLALNYKLNFPQEVRKMFRGSKEELERLLIDFSGILTTVESFGNTDRTQLIQVVNECNTILNDNKKIRITPSVISEKAMQDAVDNPGKLSKGVKETATRHFKIKAERDNPTHNK